MFSPLLTQIISWSIIILLVLHIFEKDFIKLEDNIKEKYTVNKCNNNKKHNDKK